MNNDLQQLVQGLLAVMAKADGVDLATPELACDYASVFISSRH